MYLALLSGGSGRRLWPLSNDLCSKQYLQIVSYEDEPLTKCSMLQRVWRQLEQLGLSEQAVVTASEAQMQIIQNQLGSEVCIAVEPMQRDTFPAVMLSCAFAKSILKATAQDYIVVLPIDPFAQQSFFETFEVLQTQMKRVGAPIGLIGATPTYPSEKYGYIVPQQQHDCYVTIKEFREKPSAVVAEELIAQGALWNCGVFCMTIGFAEQIMQKYALPLDYAVLCEQYTKLPKNSFDYEVLEKQSDLVAVTYNGIWKDLGTWNTVTEEMSDCSLGEVIKDDHCQNTHIINVLDIPTVVMGAENMVVVASRDGILVADKGRSSFIKECVNQLSTLPRYEERRWGTIKTLDISTDGSQQTMTRKIKIYSGMSLSYHKHTKHSEVIVIISGAAQIIMNGNQSVLHAGDNITIYPDMLYSIRAIEELRFLELQTGSLDSADICRETYDWDKIERVY